MLPLPTTSSRAPTAPARPGCGSNISPSATPRNTARQADRPDRLESLDGFSPGSPIVTHVPGMDNPQAFANTAAPTNIDIQRSLERTSPIV